MVHTDARLGDKGLQESFWMRLGGGGDSGMGQTIHRLEPRIEDQHLPLAAS